MWEVLPVVLGAALGLLVGGPTRAHWVRLVAGAVAIGIVVALASGELAESWAFVLIDSGLAVLSAVVAYVLKTAAVRSRAGEEGRPG